MSCEAYFIDELRKRGFRLTPQREIVLSVLHQLPGLATADEICEHVHAVSTAVDISTVYRTLDLLHEFDLVAVVDPGDGQRRYELITPHGSHLHLICQACGRVLGAELEPLQPFVQNIRELYGFEVDSKHLALPGLCAQCCQQKKEPPRD